MQEESNNIPPITEIPEFLQGDNWFQEEVDGDFLNFEKPYRPPRYTMERNGIAFADVGELHIISVADISCDISPVLPLPGLPLMMCNSPTSAKAIPLRSIV